MYLVKYISKDAHQISNSLAVIGGAKAYTQQYPTTALENEPQEIRNFKKFLMRTINSANGGIVLINCSVLI